MIDATSYMTPGQGPAENTAALQAAIDEAGKRGGDTVQVPAGEWMIRTLFFRDGVELNLSAGCTLLTDPDLSEYPAVEEPGEKEKLGEHYNCDRQPFHTIVMKGVSHVAITGQGTIDGNGMAFWDPPKEGGYFYVHRTKRVSPLMEIRDCQHVTLRDITIKNSPGWTVHPKCCDHILIDGITIENHLFGPNTDGIDIDGCRYVFISNCRLHCGDDAIILKAMKDARATEYVQVTNCTIETNCGALALGAETHHDIRNVVFSNCTIINSHRMLAIIMWQQGTVENILFSNITGTAMTVYGIDRPIHIDIQEHEKEDPKLGHMRNIRFENVFCRSKGRIMMTAQDGATIENVTIKDFHIDMPDLEDPSEACRNPGSTQMSNGSPISRVQRAVVIADNVHHLDLENISVTWPESPTEAVPIHGLYLRNVKDARMRCPRLRSSAPEVDPIVNVDSELTEF